MLLAVLAAPARSAPPANEGEVAVVDDYAIERGFIKTMGELADKQATLHGLKNIRQRLQEVAGKTVKVAAVAAAPGSPAAAERGVLILGSIGKRKEGGGWQLTGTASAWAISADGLIVTNHHAVAMEDDEEEEVFLGAMDRKGHVLAIKEIVADDKDADIAVLRVDAREFPLHPLPMARRVPAAGTPVGVISHPDGCYYCLSLGHVTRHHRQPVADGDVEKALKGEKVPMVTKMSISADFGVGSSGAPVLDGQGRVVGMVCQTSTVVATGSEKEAENPPADGVQMVFKDCVPLPALRAVIGAR